MEGDVNVNYYKVDESMNYPNKFMIYLDFTKLPSNFYFTKGSYAVINARLLGIKFSDYCRLCRDVFGAELVGKGHTYPSIYFPNRQTALKLISLLNAKMECFIKTYENYNR